VLEAPTAIFDGPTGAFVEVSTKLLTITDWRGLPRSAGFRPASMAALCSVSLRQLERHFANQFQQTPGKWTRDLRLCLAKEMISKGWSNKAVVSELGFTDGAHLCREFKKNAQRHPSSMLPFSSSRHSD
jgi:transcriptional regulator GlxA family with amidase domain